MSSAHYCRGCGARWLSHHRPRCPLRRRGRHGHLVRENDCTRSAPWPEDHRGRTAPHGDKAVR